LLFVRLARVSRTAMAEALTAMDLRPQDFAVMSELAEEGPSSQGELGRALRIDPGNLVGLLDRLERGGLVGRERDPEDRRRHVVRLTDEGRHQLREARRAAMQAEREMLEPLGTAERRQLQAILSRLADHSCGRGC
jgi:DNA-binding MarR family transcriptional regulator